MYFVDTNIWFYKFSKEDERKYQIAKELTVSKEVLLSLQVVNELASNLLKKLKFSEEETTSIIEHFCKLKWATITKATILKACAIRKRYQFQYWDSILLATALDAKCNIFYSEDMQNGMKIEKMTIINPFEAKS